MSVYIIRSRTKLVPWVSVLSAFIQIASARGGYVLFLILKNILYTIQTRLPGNRSPLSHALGEPQYYL